MRSLYQMVKTHRDSEAVLALLQRYGGDTPTHELEALLEHIHSWGPSRTYLCLGRLIIDRLDQEKRYGRGILIIEKCQAISPVFILPDVSRTLFYAELAIDLNKPEVARLLTGKHKPQYAPHVDTGDFVIVINAEKAVLTGRRAAEASWPGAPTRMRSPWTEMEVPKRSPATPSDATSFCSSWNSVPSWWNT